MLARVAIHIPGRLQAGAKRRALRAAENGVAVIIHPLNAAHTSRFRGSKNGGAPWTGLRILFGAFAHRNLTRATNIMHKNRRLFDLATRNSQRRTFDAFIAGHPQFQSLFAAAQLIFHQELSERLGPTIYRAIGILDDKPASSIDVLTLKTSSVEKALSSLATWIGSLPAGRYILVLGESNGLRFDGESHWISEMPGLYLELPHQQAVLLELIAISNATCLVSALDSDAAVFSEEVSGWLPDEPSQSETVFEIACWGLIK